MKNSNLIKLVKKDLKIDEFRNFNEFDLALALYHWLSHNWKWGSDPVYLSLRELTKIYKPSPIEEDFDSISKTSKLAYEQLTVKNYKRALKTILNRKIGI